MSNEKMIRPEWIPAAYKDGDKSESELLKKALNDKPSALFYKSMLISKSTLGLKKKSGRAIKLPHAGRLR